METPWNRFRRSTATWGTTRWTRDRSLLLLTAILLFAAVLKLPTLFFGLVSLIGWLTKESITTSLGVLVSALVLWVMTVIKDHQRKAKIHRNVHASRYWMGMPPFAIGVDNKLDITVTIRDVWLYTSTGGTFHLPYIGTEPASADLPEDVELDLPADRADARGFVTIPAKSGGFWGLTSSRIRGFPFTSFHGGGSTLNIRIPLGGKERLSYPFLI